MPNCSRTSTCVRPAAVAGMFYPEDPRELRGMLNELSAEVSPELREQARQWREAGRQVRAIIAPHAGYPYSGPTAASAYAFVRPWADRIERVLAIGPAHRVAFEGVAVSGEQAFETPLGQAPVDTQAVARLCERDGVRVLDQAHAPEHCLEVHLPWLIHALGATRGQERHMPAIVPMLFGETSAEHVAELIDSEWDDATLVLVSSDLSHYHDYEAARSRDAATAEAIASGEPARVGQRDACGYVAIRALLKLAADCGLEAHAVDVRNSGDTAGPRDRVVGYGAFVFA